jgi:hypothetical protein
MSPIGPSQKKYKRFHQQLVQLNTEIRKNFKGKKIPKYLRVADLQAVFDNHRGRCRNCGVKLINRKITYRHSVGLTARFEFFKPLKRGGKISRDNLILVCLSCKDEYKLPQRMLKRIPEVNTIADLIERLMIETHKAQQSDVHKNIVTALKRELNAAITEMVDSLHYSSLKDSPELDPPEFLEEESTLADTMENMAKSIIEKFEAPEEVEKLKKDLKGVTAQQRYRILS